MLMADLRTSACAVALDGREGCGRFGWPATRVPSPQASNRPNGLRTRLTIVPSDCDDIRRCSRPRFPLARSATRRLARIDWNAWGSVPRGGWAFNKASVCIHACAGWPATEVAARGSPRLAAKPAAAGWDAGEGPVWRMEIRRPPARVGIGVQCVARVRPPAPRCRGEPAAPPPAPHPEGDAAARARSPQDWGVGGAHSSARDADPHPTGRGRLTARRGHSDTATARRGAQK